MILDKIRITVHVQMRKNLPRSFNEIESESELQGRGGSDLLTTRREES